MTTATTSTTRTQQSTRIEHAFAMRESDECGYVLMEGLIGQTLAPSAGIVPGVNAALELGLAPLLSPSTCPFPVRRFRAHRTNASIFTLDGSVYLYSLGTAAAVNTPSGDNAWVQLLCEMINEHQPAYLHVANISRLVRSAEWSGQIMRVLENAGTIVIATGMEIDLRTIHGRILWQTLTMVADFERDLINQRLFAGLVNKFARGEWVLSPAAVPPGYRLDDDDRVVIDEDQIEPTRALIRLLADPTLSGRQILDQAGEEGVSSPTIRQLKGEDATYADIQSDSKKVSSLLRYVPVWETGTREVRIESPYRGITRIRDVQIVDPDPPHHHGHAVFPYDFGTPDGGWAPPPILRQVAERPARRAEYLNTSAKRRSRRQRPLSGWVNCTDDDGSKLFMSGSSRHYLLRRRATDTADTGDTGDTGDTES